MVPKPQAIEYSIYEPSDGDEMARVLGKAFTAHDPPAVAVGLDASEFETFVHLFDSKVAAEALTVVARLADTGELVGALLTEDCGTPPPEGLDQISPKFDPIFDILEKLGDEYWQELAASSGEALHMFLLGVDESVGGRGVAQQLVTTCLENGLRKNYRLAVTEATNNVSQHIFRKLGFVDRGRQSYEGHVFDGRPVFASISEHGGPILMDRPLG